MIRSIMRNMAKNRMKDMGIGNVNQKMHVRFGDKDTMPGREAIVKMQKTAQGRGKLAKALKDHPPMWKEVLCGSKKKEADEASKKAGNKRLIRRRPDNPNWPNKKGDRKIKPVPALDCAGIVHSAHI